MEEIIEQLRNAYRENEVNYKIELAKIFAENEYELNAETKITVQGHFDKKEDCYYIQFDIETNHERLATDYYRDDFDFTTRAMKDGLPIIEEDIEDIVALELYEFDLGPF